MSAENFFKEESGQKPKWGVVQADQSVYLEPFFGVIPGACMKTPEQSAGGIFRKKNAKGIETATNIDREMADPPAYRRQQTGHAINGKHPDGSSSGQCEIVFLKGTKTSIENFDAPAIGSTQDKFSFHKVSMVRKCRFYS